MHSIVRLILVFFVSGHSIKILNCCNPAAFFVERFWSKHVCRNIHTCMPHQHSCSILEPGTGYQPTSQEHEQSIFVASAAAGMVNFSNQSPFLQDDGSHNPEALCSTHERSLALVKTVMQVCMYRYTI